MNDLIAKFIEISPIIGIGHKALEVAAIQTHGIDVLHKFHGNLEEFLKYLEEYITDCAATRVDLEVKSISYKIENLIWNRLMVYSEFKNFREFLKAKIFFAAKPWNSLLAIGQIYFIANNLWYVAGDSSTDFSFYTKRMTLSALHTAVLLRFINDYSYDFEDTKVFLKNRIKNIVSFAQFKARVKNIKKCGKTSV